MFDWSLFMPVEMGTLATSVYKHKYSWTFKDGTKENWEQTAERVAREVCGSHQDVSSKVHQLILERKFMPGGRYLYAAGRRYKQVNNCCLLTVQDSRKGWADLLQRVTHALMTGMGVGVVYNDIRPRGSSVGGMGGQATGPCSLAQMVNEVGRHIQQGGSRRSAIWAGLLWSHDDIFEFIALKNWPEWMSEAKKKDFNAAATLDGTNISVILDDHFFHAYHNPSHRDHGKARRVYRKVVEQMCQNGEPGFSVDVGKNHGEHLRNACTEVTSRDDNDICNLGSLVLPRFRNLEEFAEGVEYATKFLLLGTLYSDLPYRKLELVRAKNRRLGLGLMGFHEWLLRRNKPYGKDEELGKWLEVYRDVSSKVAKDFADYLELSRPVAVRAIAPTGTISIIAETTSGLEPIFAVAFKRRYLKGNVWHAQYVVDNAAERLIRDGVDPNNIEDAYSLATDPGRRIEFQAWVQEYVDQGISSTINLPSWGSPTNNPETVEEMMDTLIEHLPRLRGITCYPDGARGGQPLVPVSYAEAIQQQGVEVVEYGNEVACPGGVCGA
jgi:ribonucleoside-diphosphate reductase alpha chain